MLDIHRCSRQWIPLNVASNQHMSVVTVSVSIKIFFFFSLAPSHCLQLHNIPVAQHIPIKILVFV
jgi:hypothetical protein